ncbi:MAG: SDR family oxidoreductase [Candidatus Tectomicrobia bacterium]|uniref:SDR family oxidoreductase n=1 Tax=Tectimicrobiota bacterium TaxID=2528274 RepID=A0A937W381_UNCTE|nr:SDR family oxidoreductase [Candidatus Tectomicrobia bacterium]
MTLHDKVAIVTGGSRGIGRAICLGLAEQGTRVVVASRTEVDTSAGTEFARYGAGTIHETAHMIQAQGGTAIAIPCDVSKATDLQQLVAATLSRFGRIDIVVSNAGIDCEAPVVDLEIDALDRCLAVNVRAPLLLCKFVLPSMLAQRSGSIFCITSGAARGYRPGRVGYSMSKAALDRMFLSLAEEVREANIAVNVLSPGRVDTWMNRRGDWPGTAHIPMAQPEAIIPAAVWLAQQGATSFTGHWVERAEFGITWGAGCPT